VDGLGLGYGPFFGGGYLWMAVLQRKGIPRNTPEVLYPSPDQKEVPLRYPAEDQPSPIPKEHGNKPAGYAITAWFPYKTPISDPDVVLVDEEDRRQDGWLSAPGRPAIEDYQQQCSICFLPKKPLRPNTTYTVTFSAQVNERPWKRSWSFTTWKDPEAPDPGLSQRLLTEANACRKNAGLPAVQLDDTLSQGCRQHARYLILNKDSRAVEGLKMHKEDPSLPGYSREGARAASGLIAAIGNPDAAVGDWMATLYHRLPLLNPRLERIGLACLRYPDGKWACVLDTVNGKRAQ
jgi:uncharacterized protein YkwD